MAHSIHAGDRPGRAIRRTLRTVAGGLAALAAATIFWTAPALARNQPVICESQNYGYKHCSMKTSYGVLLVTQLSRGRGECIEGQSWGWDSGGVWVTQGCRGSFIQGNWAGDYPQVNRGQVNQGASAATPAIAPAAGTDFGGGRCYRPNDAVTCASQNYRYTRCPMKTSYGVKIVAQLSAGRGECVEGRTWGWDSGGVWVDGGCRGRFIQGNWDACGPTPGVPRQADRQAAAAGIPVTGMPWQSGGQADQPPSGGWRPSEAAGPAASSRDLTACRDSLNTYVQQQASRARHVSIDVERTDARRQGNNVVVEETAMVSTDFGRGRLNYRCTLSSSGRVIAFDAQDS